MTLRPLLRATALLATGFALSACAAYKSGMGIDPLSHSEAELVTWSDGQPAVEIQCLEARGCGQRARAICMPRGLKVLKRAVEATPPAVIVRCG
ncbi:MAG: hypothetical protein EPO67_05410 [Reyranella sp.]|nr:MAG: hypothetical protein EPO67_05410 [Reyranella sp.]